MISLYIQPNLEAPLKVYNKIKNAIMCLIYTAHPSSYLNQSGSSFISILNRLCQHFPGSINTRVNLHYFSSFRVLHSNQPVNPFKSSAILVIENMCSTITSIFVIHRSNQLRCLWVSSIGCVIW